METAALAGQDGMNSDIDQLITAMSQDVRPIGRHALVRRVLLGILAGAVATAFLVVASLGIRPDLDIALHGFSFWMKLTYTTCLGVLAVHAVTRLARPTLVPERSLGLLGLPVLILAGAGTVELLRTPVAGWPDLWLGRSWQSCPWLLLMFAVPIFAGLLWSFRTLAPTRLRDAGAAAGLCSGAWAAAIYCLHCPETSAVFVLTWYSLGILLATGAGALLGPRLLRW